MKLAFFLFRHSRFGGLERNFLRIARACTDRQHDVQVFTMDWKGDRPADLHISLVPARGLRNHSRCRSYVAWLARNVDPTDFDLVVGFNRMPGLDLYYAADVCYVHDMARRRRGPLYRLTSRYRTYAAFEHAVFSPQARTEIMYLSQTERDHYIAAYGTPESRFHYLPPGVDRQRIRRSLTPETSARIRAELGLSHGDVLLLMVGSDFRRKGVARSIRALASLPAPLRVKSHLIVIGRGKGAPLRRLAAALHIQDRVRILGGRGDVPDFLAAADLLLHPAVSENTGNAIAEALVAGLPVLATETCGYAFHVRDSGAGEVIPSDPFDQQVMNQRLAALLQSPDLAAHRQAAFAYTDTVDLYSRPQTAVRIIETVAARRRSVPR
jgi:UDP-glucose:(heptosyl)LPS alpha-1,3-glucosyltransferase